MGQCKGGEGEGSVLDCALTPPGFLQVLSAGAVCTPEHAPHIPTSCCSHPQTPYRPQAVLHPPPLPPRLAAPTPGSLQVQALSTANGEQVWSDSVAAPRNASVPRVGEPALIELSAAHLGTYKKKDKGDGFR